jgi:hypothetical protein
MTDHEETKELLRIVAIYIRCDIHLKNTGYSPVVYSLKMKARAKLTTACEHSGIKIKDIDLSITDL